MKHIVIILMTLFAKEANANSILYSELNNGNWDLYSYSLTTDTVTRLTRHPLRDFQSDHSKMQNKVVFDSYRDNSRNIYTLDLANNKITQLTHLESRDGHPTYSPDGNFIAFQSSRTGDSEVFVMESSGANVKQLTHSKGFDGIPKWSQNGDKLAFNSSRSGTPNVFIIDRTTNKTVQVTHNQAKNFVQDWLSDTSLLVISNLSGENALCTVDIATAKFQKIPVSQSVTHARYDLKTGRIVYTGVNKSKSTNIFITDISGSNTRQLTNTDTEKRFPTFMLD